MPTRKETSLESWSQTKKQCNPNYDKLPAVILVVALIVIGGCSLTSGNNRGGNEDTNDWRNVELKDIKTGVPFKISDFKGKTILLQSFAVWCPTCKSQQDELDKLKNDVGDDIEIVSIDTDPNEDKKRVIGHIDRFEYDWLFSIDQNKFAEKLVDEFGINVVNAPSSPVILIDKDQNSRLLRSGLKREDRLKEEIDKGA